MVLLKIIWPLVSGLKIMVVLSITSKILLNSLKGRKHYNSENTDDFRKDQWQIYFEIGQVTLKPFSLKEKCHQLINPISPGRFETVNA